jgi:hypothetical protein
MGLFVQGKMQRKVQSNSDLPFNSVLETVSLISICDSSIAFLGAGTLARSAPAILPVQRKTRPALAIATAK